MVQSQVFFSDLPLDISVASNGDINLVTNKAAISQSLRMLINTARGSRVFASNYGCRIRGFLFEPFDESTAKRIGEELRETIINYERRIKLLDINVIMNDKETSYDVEVSYQIVNRNETETLVVTLEKV
jgi:phage baseplate assembly protein W